MVDTVIVNKANDNVAPTLEETARSMGINPENLDSTSTTQTAKESAQKILGKFETQADLEKAYVELQKKLGQQSANKPKADAPEVKPPVNPEAPPIDKSSELPSDNEDNTEGNTEGKSEEEQAKEVTDKAGLDLNALSNKWNEKGALDDADYEALQKVGIPKEYVDAFAEGQAAKIELVRQSAFAVAGGEDSYWSMVDWAGNNLSEAEAVAFNNAVDGRDRNVANLAIKGLKAQYEAARGREPTKTYGGSARGGDTSAYQSVAQMQKDMADPRYRVDPAYRAKVEAKLGRSNIL